MINEKIISLDAEKECDKFQYPFFFGGWGLPWGPLCSGFLQLQAGATLVDMHRLVLATSSLVAEPELQACRRLHSCVTQAQLPHCMWDLP